MDPNKLKKRYDDTRADNYVNERANDQRWKLEHEAVATFLSKLGPESSVLDIPIGTGRFIPLYSELGINATGIDASKNMLERAITLAKEVGSEISLGEGDIFLLDFKDGSFDAVVCMRFLNWINTEDLKPVIRELTRVSQNFTILAIEQYTPLSQFNFLSWPDIRRALIQTKRRFYMWRTQNDYVYHPAREVENTFKECRLELVEQIQIPRSRDEGIEYHAYLLKKKPVSE